MVERFIEHIDSTGLFSPNDTLLVGVSGGLDSVVLADLLYHSGFAFAMAHCNFNLRGEESDRDEAFVKELASKYGKPFFHQSFDTTGVSENEGVSIEMAARNLRYAWFEEIRKRGHFDWILVAHHLDDQIETFFLNLSRGTGISGLTGIKPVNGHVVRPLLFVSRQEILAYASERNLDFREDSSNLQMDYQRNKVRHMVIPLMEELNPSFRNGMQETIRHLHDAFLIFHQAVNFASERAIMRRAGGEIEISLAELRLLNPMPTYLFEMLKPFHFNGEVVEEIIKCLDGQPGKQFHSPTHRAILDREYILVLKNREVTLKRTYIEEKCAGIDAPVKLRISFKKREKSLLLNTPAKLALIDRDKVRFPLILRKWQTGDFFQPLGMKGLKKLSDFFVDEKFSLADKENVWLLTNGEEIVWIIGARLDDRYKITPETRNILEIEQF